MYAGEETEQIDANRKFKSPPRTIEGLFVALIVFAIINYLSPSGWR
jgi:hypothetical protein